MPKHYAKETNETWREFVARFAAPTGNAEKALEIFDEEIEGAPGEDKTIADYTLFALDLIGPEDHVVDSDELQSVPSSRG
jgi:hypothetical protein